MRYLPIILIAFLLSCGEQDIPSKSVEEPKKEVETATAFENKQQEYTIEPPAISEHINNNGDTHYSKTISSFELFQLGDTLTLDINPILNGKGKDDVGTFFFEKAENQQKMMYVELHPENWEVDKEATYEEQNCFYIYLQTHISRKGKKITLKQLQKLMTDFSYNCISDVGC